MKISKVNKHVSVYGNSVEIIKGEVYNDLISGMYPDFFEDMVTTQVIEEVVETPKEELLIEAPISVSVEIVEDVQEAVKDVVIETEVPSIEVSEVEVKTLDVTPKVKRFKRF